ncbi:MAG: menaquinone biosynthetic enzyme MqnA/MqnD family protein [Candidatus Krumholzibacteriia bacterium]
MSIRLGRIPYLNSEVFYQDFPLDLVEVTDYVPSALSRAARRGEVDIGPVPTVTGFELEDQFMPFRNFGIAVRGKARSVLLFSRRPVEELQGSRIGITGESATSVRLLKVLLTRHYGVIPERYVSTKEVQSDAVLLIGDAALNNRKGLPSYPRVYDLAEMWEQWTGLPFVFARWIVRKDLNQQALDFLGELLSKSLERGMQRIDQIAAKRADLSMTVEEVREYLHGFTYILGDKEDEAIELFRTYLEAYDHGVAAVGKPPLGKRPNAG